MKVFGRLGWLPFLAVLLIGIGLRFYGLGLHPLWIDEAITWNVSERDDIAAALQERYQHSEPPLIHMVVRPMRLLTGDPALLRMVPAFFGSLALLVWLGIVRTWIDSRWAIGGFAVFSLSAFHIFYSQELRSYAITSLLALCLLALYLRWLGVGSLRAWHWVVLGTTEALMVYSHYLAVIYCLAPALTVPFIPEYRRSLRAWLLAQGLAVVLFLPWLPQAIRCVTIIRDVQLVTDYRFLRDLAAPFVILPLGKSLIPHAAHTLYRAEQVAMLLPGLIMAAMMLVGSTRTLKERKGKLWFVLVMAGVAPVVILNLYSVFIQVNYNYVWVKYLMGVYPPCLLIAFLGFADLRHRAAVVGLGIAIATWIAVNLWVIGNYFHNTEYRKDSDFPAAVKILEEKAQPGELVACSTIRMSLPFQCHLLESPLVASNPVGVLSGFRDGPIVERHSRGQSRWELLPSREEETESFWVLVYADWRPRMESGWQEVREKWKRKIAEFIAQGQYKLQGTYFVRGVDMFHLVRIK